jgi:hypothetical protein
MRYGHEVKIPAAWAQILLRSLIVGTSGGLSPRNLGSANVMLQLYRRLHRIGDFSSKLQGSANYRPAPRAQCMAFAPWLYA